MSSIISISSLDAKPNVSSLLAKSKFELNVEFSNASTLAYRDRLVSLIDTAIDEYTTLFVGLPKKLNGSPYTSLTVRVSNGFGGEVDPEFIDLRVSDA